MARFYVKAGGQASGEVHRVGSANSGAYAHVSGWDIGVYVTIEDHNGRDVITVWKTGGSNAPNVRSVITTFTRPPSLSECCDGTTHAPNPGSIENGHGMCAECGLPVPEAEVEDPAHPASIARQRAIARRRAARNSRPASDVMGDDESRVQA